MGKVAKRPPMTAERFLRRGYTQGYELVNGRMKEKAMGMEASWVQGELGFHLRLFTRQNPGWQVFDSEAMYQCFPHKPEQVRKPDVSVLRTDKLPPEGIPKGVSRVAPDLIAEVLSPNEKAVELNGKLDDFIRAGVPLIWVINPDARAVTVHVGRQSVTLTAADELTGDPVLPGFRVKVADLFPPAPPPAS